jgi:hypothetical protein
MTEDVISMILLSAKHGFVMVRQIIEDISLIILFSAIHGIVMGSWIEVANDRECTFNDFIKCKTWLFNGELDRGFPMMLDTKTQNCTCKRWVDLEYSVHGMTIAPS